MSLYDATNRVVENNYINGVGITIRDATKMINNHLIMSTAGNVAITMNTANNASFIGNTFDGGYINSNRGQNLLFKYMIINKLIQ